MRSRAWIVLAGMAAACTSRETIFIARPWPADHTAVLVLADERGTPLESRPRVYAPGELLQFEPPALGMRFRLHLATFAPETRSIDDRSIAECGVVFDAERTPLPPPASTWISPLLDLESSTHAELLPPEAPPAFTLHFESCDLPASCEGYKATAVEAPPRLLTRCIAVLDDDTAIFGAKSRGGKMIFGKIDGTTATLLPIDDRLDGDCNELVHDPAAGGLHAISDNASGAYYFRLDEAGVLSFGPKFHRLSKIGVAPDGTRIVSDRDGDSFELTETGTTSILIPRPEIPRGVKDLVVLARDKIFARNEDKLYYYDGISWLDEHTISLIESVSDLGGDDEVIAVVGEIELVRVRDPVTRMYEVQSRPFDRGARLRGVAGIGGGRFIVVGEGGGVGVWNGDRWCELEIVVAAPLSWISAGASGRVAYATGDSDLGADGQTPLVRIDLPIR